MEIEAGVPFYVRRTNVLRDAANPKFTAKRTINVPDLIGEKAKADTVFQEKEAKRDQTWEEFLASFTDHIEGKIDPITRTAGRRDRDLQPAGVVAPVEEEEDDEAAEMGGRPKS